MRFVRLIKVYMEDEVIMGEVPQAHRRFHH